MNTIETCYVLGGRASLMAKTLSSVGCRPLADIIPYSGFYLRGPNFCKICEVLTSSQILILHLLWYHQHVPTATWTNNRTCYYTNPRLSKENMTIADIRLGTCPTTVVLQFTLCSNGKRIMAIESHVSLQQTSTFPITLDWHTSS